MVLFFSSSSSSTNPNFLPSVYTIYATFHWLHSKNAAKKRYWERTEERKRNLSARVKCLFFVSSMISLKKYRKKVTPSWRMLESQISVSGNLFCSCLIFYVSKEAKPVLKPAWSLAFMPMFGEKKCEYIEAEKNKFRRRNKKIGKRIGVRH